MSIYTKNEWIDHIEDVDTGEVLQVGTLYCARLMNHMEDGGCTGQCLSSGEASSE